VRPKNIIYHVQKLSNKEIYNKYLEIKPIFNVLFWKNLCLSTKLRLVLSLELMFKLNLVLDLKLAWRVCLGVRVRFKVTVNLVLGLGLKLKMLKLKFPIFDF
jgi:hypothetical protein